MFNSADKGYFKISERNTKNHRRIFSKRLRRKWITREEKIGLRNSLNAQTHEKR